MNKLTCAKLYGLQKCPVSFNMTDIILVQSSQSLVSWRMWFSYFFWLIFIDNLTFHKVYNKNRKEKHELKAVRRAVYKIKAKIY